MCLAFIAVPWAQSITHQITLPSGETWCSDTMITGLLTSVNAYRAQGNMAALTMNSLGMKDAELRAVQFAAYMATNPPGSTGFNPHTGWDTTAASLGYKIAGENLAWLSTDPNYIVNAAWQDPLHINAMLATANAVGVSCIWSAGVPYWTYEPGNVAAPTIVPSLDSEDWSFLSLINAYRAQNGAGPLTVSVALENSSTWMSNDMAAKNYISHTDSLGRDPFTRMNAFGYAFVPAGENLAAGAATAQATFTQWQTACDPDTSGNCTYAHRLNMLNPSYRAIGIARAYGASSAYGWYWTTDFGGVVDQAIAPPSAGPAPTIFSFTASPMSITAGQQTTLSWSVSGATTLTLDNGIGDVSTLTSRVVAPLQTTTYHLTATNASGSASALFTVTVLATGDTQPPTAPSNLAGKAKSATEIDLTWTPSSDNVGVSGYQVIRNNVPVANVAAASLSYADTSVTANTGYMYAVKAYDAAGNYSTASIAVQVTTPSASTAGIPRSLTVVSGSGQSATAGAAFAAPLQVKVVDASGNPVQFIMVAFNAPVSGASATFTGGVFSALAVTNASGIAASPALTADAVAGSYSISASATGLTAVAFSLTNTAAFGTGPNPGSGGGSGVTGNSGGASIWPASTVPSIASFADGKAVELGLKFRSSVAGTITGIRFYKSPLSSGIHTGSLWSSSGTLLASGTFTGETASGWQTMSFSSPVAIAANTTYVASYHSANGMYSIDFGYFLSHGVDSGSLHALQYGASGPNGVYLYGPGGQFPTTDGHGNNYWVDVVLGSDSGTTPPPPPNAVPASISAVSGAGQVASAGSAFGATLQAKVLDGSGNPLSGVSVTFTAPVSGASATFPGGTGSATASTNSLGIAASPSLTANGIGGTYAVTASVSGLAPTSFTLTNTAASTAPPPPTSSGALSIWSDSTTPSIRSLADGNPVELGVKFRSSSTGSITGVRFYKGPLNTGVHTGSLWSSNGTLLATGTFTNESSGGWQTLTFSTPVTIAANTTYVASYHSANGIYAIDFSYFLSHGATNGPLQALQYGVDGPDGVFVYGPGGKFPTGGNGNNYWVDVLFVTH